MDREANNLSASKDPNYMNRRTLSSRKDKRGAIKNLTSQQSARTLHGAKSIQMKPENILNKARPGSKLVPNFPGQRNQSVQLKQTLSEQKLPTKFKNLGITSKHSAHQSIPNALPPLKKSLSKRTLAGSSLQRVFSNPQFTKLNQHPYFRPKTSAFGYLNGNGLKKDPSKKAPWTSEQVNSITGIKTMTSLAPANAVLREDQNNTSPAKRSLSRKERRKKTSQMSHRVTMYGTMLDKRPNTSNLLQNAAERMAWPNKPEGRAKISPLTPIKAFTFKGDVESQFLHSEKDYRMSIDNFNNEADYLQSPHSKIEEVDEFDREDDEKYEIASVFSGASKEVSPKNRTMKRSKNTTINDVIKLLQNEPKETGQYFYLIQPHGKGPYELQPILELEDHDKKLKDYKIFYTLSNKGITTYFNDEPVRFITLNDWLVDKKNYNKIRAKTFFQKFDRWKVLKLWRRKINVKKRETVSEILNDKLFILHKHFNKVILDLKTSCCEMEKLTFIELTDSHEAISRETFSQKQETRRTLVKEKIETHSKK